MTQLPGAMGQKLCSLELPSPPPGAGWVPGGSAKVLGLQGNGDLGKKLVGRAPGWLVPSPSILATRPLKRWSGPLGGEVGATCSQLSFPSATWRQRLRSSAERPGPPANTGSCWRMRPGGDAAAVQVPVDT